MISKGYPKKVKIHITTYAKQRTNKISAEMSKQGAVYGCKNDHNSRFICSICLNTNVREEPKKLECDRRKSRSCPVCQGASDINANKSYEIAEEHNTDENDKLDDPRTKTVQTSRTNVDHELLNEVLTVFQGKRDNNMKERHSKTILLKDACVSAELGMNKPKLSVSRIFRLSIEGGGIQESGKFYVIDSYQPNFVRSQYSIDLIKHKSSSIPQMKMDELKNSLKEKTKTKGPIDEVNRMFATVKRDDSFDNINRPMIRNGPRVLPVVKTSRKQSHRQSDEDISVQSNKPGCKCCQTNFSMSSGDYVAKPDRCENISMQCCHKNSNRDVQTESLICDRCRNPNYGFD